MREELVFTTVAGDGEFGEAENGDVGGAGVMDTLQNTAAVSAPVHRDLVEAARAYSNGVAHDERMIARRGQMPTAKENRL